MEFYEQLYTLLVHDSHLMSLLWTPEDGFTMLGKDRCVLPLASLDFSGKDPDYLLSLTPPEEYPVCRIFLNQLKEIPDRDDVTHRSCNLHLAAGSGADLLYHINYNAYWGADNILKYALFRFREISAEESYRLDLALSVTNDKHPRFLVQGADAIIAKHPEAKYAFIQFDIAKFKMINEQYGEDFGTEVLNYIIHGLKLICDDEQLFVRLSGDVFMIFTAYETKQDLYDLIHHIEKELSSYQGVTYRLVFGICPIDDLGKSLRFYGDNAAFARLNIKQNALTNIAFFEEKLREKARIRMDLEGRMEKALANGEFVMFLQPKYSISKNQIIGAEALVRWMSPEQGMIPPMEFIPLFEQNGFIIKMDFYIWEQACKTIRRWMDEGKQPIPISVNMSRKHFQHHDFITALNHLVDQYGIDKQYLEIEITETADNEDTAASINLLKDNGYTLLMDDFGSGYSTLNTLKDTRFDIVKIDRGFFRDFVESNRGQKIVAHIVEMTQSLGMDIIAEGVENYEQATFLSSCGCDKVQGFYYAKPMCLSDFEDLRNKN